MTAATRSFTAAYFGLGWRAATEKEAENGKNQKNNEQYPSDIGGCTCDAAVSEDPGDEGDD